MHLISLDRTQWRYIHNMLASTIWNFQERFLPQSEHFQNIVAFIKWTFPWYIFTLYISQHYVCMFPQCEYGHNVKLSKTFFLPQLLYLNNLHSLTCIVYIRSIYDADDSLNPITISHKSFVSHAHAEFHVCKAKNKVFLEIYLFQNIWLNHCNCIFY